MANSRIPFTDSQWEELENQALVFKYIAANVPVPPHLLFLIRRPYLFSSSSSSSSTFLSPHFGWNVYGVGMGRKMDAEPGRCRRTDGKKWRCSKEASTESKYCERHMHRGKNRSSRKPLPPPPQFSLSSTKPSLFLDSPLSSTSRIRRRNGCMDDFFSLQPPGTKVLDEKREQRDDHEEEEGERSKKVYRFIDEWPSSKSSVSTSLFI